MHGHFRLLHAELLPRLQPLSVLHCRGYLLLTLTKVEAVLFFLEDAIFLPVPALFLVFAVSLPFDVINSMEQNGRASGLSLFQIISGDVESSSKNLFIVFLGLFLS
mmetsp:Transcript_46393/g.97063  ORF Transcript_46393/g.97063 Transcript_46393/m.97063 type:complete len:106 (+) Transcript_46393:331-648(+)